MPTDLEIARAARLRPLPDVAADMGIGEHLLEPYGRAVAKVRLEATEELAERPRAKYVLVTAVTPTPLGEGKTTTAVGLAQAFRERGRRAVLTLRQPSMGPTFGIKGGAAGGGYSQVVPMEAMNLHLTGDFHAVTAAHNLLAALVDNHLHHGNELGLDLDAMNWRRVLDVNDRSLRNIVIGLGAKQDGVTRQSGFDITAASEVMTILGLATSLADLRQRLGRIVIGFDAAGGAVTAEDVRGAGAMAVVMREAIKPNLLQTLAGTPVLVHAGPFGNIATGSSSIVADRIGIHGGDYLITEAGFAADMGAERFFNIKCRTAGLAPDVAVIVATVRALKAHSGRFTITAGRPLPEELLAEGPADMEAGLANLAAMVAIVRRHGVTPVVAINAFPTDHPSEHAAITRACDALGVRSAVTTHVADGGPGALALAAVVEEAGRDEPSDFRLLYPLDVPLAEKIETIATEIYGAGAVEYTPAARRQLARFEQVGYGGLPICMAKTHLSISADPALNGAPTGHTVTVREARLSAGAGFVYAICGEMRTMPGLGRSPAATRIDLDDHGEIVGLS